MLSRLGDRVEVLEWAQSLQRPGDAEWVKTSNDAVESYLSGQISKRALQAVACYSPTDAGCWRYETPGEAMAYFAAFVALTTTLNQGFLNEVLSKAEEYGIHRVEGEWVVDEALAFVGARDPSIVDSHRWTPTEGDAEMEEWENILGKRPASV